MTPLLLTPIEVKWTERPTKNDAKHLQVFIDEYEKARSGYIICQTPTPMKITDKITAIPWQNINELF